VARQLPGIERELPRLGQDERGSAPTGVPRAAAASVTKMAFLLVQTDGAGAEAEAAIAAALLKERASSIAVTDDPAVASFVTAMHIPRQGRDGCPRIRFGEGVLLAQRLH
jgi:hypothetical protein